MNRRGLDRALPALIFVAAVVACGTTLDASNYASDCDADTQCDIVRVGDICSCGCDLAAINDRDYDKYVNDLERIGGCRNSCVSDDPDATFTCGAGVVPKCNSGVCAIVAAPSDGGAE